MSSLPPPVPVARDPENSAANYLALIMLAMPLLVPLLGLIIGFVPALVVAVVVIGAAVIVGHDSVLAAFRWHTPELEVAPGLYHLGSQPTVVYRRRPRRVMDIPTCDIECKVMCEESVTYQQGTDTRTDTRIVFEQDCSGTGEGTADGLVSHLILDISAHAGGPSLLLGHNTIKWVAEIGAKGPRLPNDTHTFEIDIGSTLDHRLRPGLQDT